MKDNGFILDSDGICLFISTALSTPLTGKVILILLNLLTAGLLWLTIVENIIVLALLLAGILLMLIRYSLWNFYGKEYFTINTKAIRYQHDYGFFKTSVQIKKIGKNLTVQAVHVYQFNRAPQLSIIFVSYDANDFPEEIYRMAIPITKNNADSLVKAVNLLYIDKVTDDYSLPPIYMN